MRVVISVALGLAAAMLLAPGAARVQGQAASPSVRAAARLKYSPPPNWIRHYLPDDRYKLAGGAWKVVSTETDSYYYPAWAPEMLRQSNGIVIGFPSAAAAEEAGYKRSKYPMESPLLGITGHPLPTPPAAASPFGGLSVPQEGLKATVNRGKAQRITLADGASTTILPAGWTHLSQLVDAPPGQRGAVGAQQIKVDVFAPGAVTPEMVRDPKARIVLFGFSTMPQGMSAERIFDPAMVNAVNNRNAQASAQTGQRNVQARSTGFGDVRGIVLNIPAPPLGTIPIAFAGRGSKMYVMYDGSRNARGSRDIIRGFRGR